MNRTWNESGPIAAELLARAEEHVNARRRHPLLVLLLRCSPPLPFVLSVRAHAIWFPGRFQSTEYVRSSVGPGSIDRNEKYSRVSVSISCATARRPEHQSTDIGETFLHAPTDAEMERERVPGSRDSPRCAVASAAAHRETLHRRNQYECLQRRRGNRKGR
jgi:hypothetical protein